MNELVSIITPTYNSAKFISETINSSNQNERLIIWESFLKNTDFLPNGVFFGNSENLIDQPHNFFVEYTYACGYIFGIPFIILIFNLIKFCFLKSPIIGRLMLFYLIPFSLSSGLTAAKYFLFFIFLILGIKLRKSSNYLY